MALVVDNLVLLYLPVFLIGFALAAIGVPQIASDDHHLCGRLHLHWPLLLARLTFPRRGPGQAQVGLKVVQSKDGTSPLSHGQGIVRWLSVLIPFFNLFDVSVPYRDPLIRRFGDRWAGTRVIDSEKKLTQAREKTLGAAQEESSACSAVWDDNG